MYKISGFYIRLFLLFVLCHELLANEPVTKSALTDKVESRDIVVKNDSFTRSGEISVEQLLSDYPLFKKSYEDFSPTAEDVEQIKSLAGSDVVIFMGLWCHDSQREVPHLVKLIEQAGNPFQSVKIIALTPSKMLDKEYAKKFEVTHTPTIFVLKHDKIVASIVEKPQVSLAQDLVNQIHP